VYVIRGSYYIYIQGPELMKLILLLLTCIRWAVRAAVNGGVLRFDLQIFYRIYVICVLALVC